MLKLQHRIFDNESFEVDGMQTDLIEGEALIVEIGPKDRIDDETAEQFETLGFSMEDNTHLSETEILPLAYFLVVEAPGKVDPAIHQAVENIVADYNSRNQQ